MQESVLERTEKDATDEKVDREIPHMWGAVHFFARRREVVRYRKKPGARQEHESEEDQTGAQ